MTQNLVETTSLYSSSLFSRAVYYRDPDENQDTSHTDSVATAATQFIIQSIEIVEFLSELYPKPEDAPDVIRKHIAHVQGLSSLVVLVQKNPALKVDEIATILNRCVDIMTQLRATLEKVSAGRSDSRVRKVQKAISAVLKEKEIAEYFDQLEQQKSLLTTLIKYIDSGNISTINAKSDEIIAVTGDLSDATKILPTISEGIIDIKDMLNSSLKRRTTFGRSANLLQPEHRVQSYFLVPNRRVPRFIGREDTLRRINEAFSSQEVLPCIVVIRAMGGQGKTQVALEYCHRVRDKPFKAIFWVDATSENTLRKSFEAMAQKVKAPGEILQEGSGYQFLMDKLYEWPEPWLMVFDNHDNPESFHLQTHIPQGELGHVLITSRHSSTDELASEEAIELPGLNPQDAMELLLKQAQLKEPGSNGDRVAEIVERLCYHPLAITQAGSYIKLRKIHLNDFLAQYESQKEAILRQTPQMTVYRRRLNDADNETALNVFTTWELSFNQIQESGRSGSLAADLLTLLAFFDCKDISEQLFVALSAIPSFLEQRLDGPGRVFKEFFDVKGLWKSHEFVSVLIQLTATSLLQTWSRESDGFSHFSLHPLVKDWILLRTDIANFQDYYILSAEIIGQFLKAHEHFKDFKIAPSDIQALLSHADVHLENTSRLSSQGRTGLMDVFPSLNESRTWIARLLSKNGRERDAGKITLDVLTWREKNLGLENALTLDSLDDRSCDLAEDGRWAEAMDSDRRMIKGCEKLFGHDNVRTFSAYDYLFCDYIGSENYEEAEKIYETHIKPYQKRFGPDCETTSESLHHHAWMFEEQKKHDIAELEFRQALDGYRRVAGPGHFLTLTLSGQLAGNLIAQGKYAEAQILRREMGEQVEKTFGSKHPELLINDVELGWLLYFQKEYSKAEEFIRELVEEKKRTMGLEDSATLLCLRLLAIILGRDGSSPEADEIYEIVTATEAQQGGPKDGSSYIAYWRCGNELEKLEQYLRAEQCYRQAYAGEQHLLGAEHQNSLITLSKIGMMLIMQDKPAEAESCFREVTETSEKTRLLEEISDYFGWLGYSLQLQKQYAEAEIPYQKCYEGRLKRLGLEHDETVDMLNTISANFKSQQKLEQAEEAVSEAERAYQKLCDSQEKTLGVDNPATLKSLWLYQSILENVQRSPQREEILRRIVKGREMSLGPEHAETLSALSALAELLREQLKHEASAELYGVVFKARERVLGLEHTDTRNALWLLSDEQLQAKMYSESITNFKKLIPLQEKSLGTNHTDTITCLGQLGQALVENSEWLEAEICLRRVIETQEETRDLEDMHATLYWLGSCLVSQKKYTEAEEIYQKCYDTRCKLLGLEDISTLIARSWLAQIQREQENYSEAEAIYRSVCEILEKTQGLSHADTLLNLWWLQVTLEKLQKAQDREDVWHRIIKGREQLLGPEHIETLNGLSFLGLILRDQGKHLDAETVYQRLWTARSTVLSQDGGVTCLSLWWLGYEQLQKEKYGKSVIGYQRLVPLQEITLGADGVDTTTCIGQALREHPDWQAAVTIYERLHEIWNKVLGPEHADTRFALWGWSICLKSNGNFAEATEKYKSLCDIQEAVLGAEHTDTMICLSQYGNLALEQENWSISSPVLQKLFEIQKKVLGLEHDKTQTSLSQLSISQWKEKKLEQSGETYKQLCALKEKLYGGEAQVTISCLTNMGQVFREQFNWPEAVKTYQHLFEIQERAVAYGPEHQETRKSLWWLSFSLKNDKRLAEAEESYRRLCRVQEKALDSDKADKSELMSCLEQFGQLLREISNWAAASKVYQQLYDIKSGALNYGPEHSETRSSFWWYCFALKEDKKYPEATVAYQRLCEMQGKILGQDHDDTISCLTQYGRLLYDSSNWPDAISLFTKLKSVQEKKLGPEHANTRQSLWCLSWSYLQDNQYGKSQELYEQLSPMLEKELGPDNSLTLSTLTQYGQSLSAQSKWSEAAEVHRRVLKIRESANIPPDIWLLVTLAQIAECLRAQKQYTEAATTIRLQIVRSEELYGLESEHTMNAVQHLGVTLELMGDLDESEACFRRALEGYRKLFAETDPRLAAHATNYERVLAAQKTANAAKLNQHQQLTLQSKTPEIVDENQSSDSTQVV